MQKRKGYELSQRESTAADSMARSQNSGSGERRRRSIPWRRIWECCWLQRRKYGWLSSATPASGMINYIFVAYSNALAALILLPLSLLVHSYLSLSIDQFFYSGLGEKGIFLQVSESPAADILDFLWVSLGAIAQVYWSLIRLNLK